MRSLGGVVLTALLVWTVLLVGACGGGQKAEHSGERNPIFQGELAVLASAEVGADWQQDIAGLAQASRDGQKLLVEVRYIAGMLPLVRQQLKQNSYSIQLVKQHYERLNVWVASAEHLMGLGRIEGVSFVTLAPATDLLSGLKAVD